MRILFVSFTSTMNGLVDGHVMLSDLDTGLFAFGCTREHVFGPGVAGEYVEEVVREYPATHLALKIALCNAEAEGRVVWRQGYNMSYKLVSDLLVRNGFGEITGLDGRSINGPYCYPGVEDRVRERGYDLAVYRGGPLKVSSSEVR